MSLSFRWLGQITITEVPLIIALGDCSQSLGDFGITRLEHPVYNSVLDCIVGAEVSGAIDVLVDLLLVVARVLGEQSNEVGIDCPASNTIE
jgi:hypothetical protein